MSVTNARLTLEEYLSYDDGTDTRYELVAGELVAMPPKSPQNLQIALFLLTQFFRFVPLNRLSNKIELVVGGSRTTTRTPDLMVLTDELVEVLRSTSRSTTTLDMPSPL